MTYATCILDSARGIYIPQNFAELINPEDWTGIDAEDLDVLKTGPDHESYWDAWQNLLDCAESKNGAVLYQDGDLFLIYRDRAVQDLNAYLESVLGYETNHGDARDAYASIVPESVDAEDVRRQLRATRLEWDESLKFYADVPALDLDLRGLDIDRVVALALDCFNMVPGSIWGPYGDAGLVLAGFPVQEIETEIPADFDGIVLDFIGDNGTDAYIPQGGRLAYMTTDSTWFAVASVKDLQEAIDAEVKLDA